MRFYIGVENFAKIKEAKVCINEYSVLVGLNDSGKSFFMQLVQGISGTLKDIVDEDVLKILSIPTYRKYGDYVICKENIPDLVNYMNERLEKEKDNLVSEIFGRKISIGKLYIDLQTESSEEDIVYSVMILRNKKEIQEYINSGMDWEGPLNKFCLDAELVIVFTEYSTKENHAQSRNISIYLVDNMTDLTMVNSAFICYLGKNGIYLPAARTGLLMLYREYFANKVDNMRGKMIYNQTKGKFVEENASIGNLTKPVYEFLRFLQTYSEGNRFRDKYQEELDFFEKNIIIGHLESSEQGQFTYNPKNSEMSIPLYLTSSMINEVVPILLAITSDQGYERVIIDEVEASLHPEKQLELVRFLNRLCNKGMQFIISTHSDTFVSKLNNLYILSHNVKDNEEILKKLNLDSEDLIDTGRLHIYEFINQDNGMSLVKEVSGDPKRGFQFDLFTGTAMKLYDETLMVEGLTGK